MHNQNLLRASGVFLLLLGVVAQLLRMPMPVATALGFALIGSVLLLQGSDARIYRNLRISLCLIIIALASAVLLHRVFNIPFDLEQALANFVNSSLWGGSMTLDAAFALLLSGLTLMMTQRELSVRPKWENALLQAFGLGVILCGLIGITGSALHWELYGSSDVVLMPALTAIGFITLGTVLGLQCYRANSLADPYSGKEDTKISAIGAVILLIVALAAGLAVFAILVPQVESLLKNNLAALLSNRAQLFQSAVDQQVESLSLVSSRSRLRALMSRVSAGQAAATDLRQIQMLLESETPADFLGMELYDARGKKIAVHGRLVGKPEMEVNLNTPNNVVLLWDKEFILKVGIDIFDADVRVGKLVAEMPLHPLTNMIHDTADFGKTSEFAVCAPWAEKMQCFPLRLAPKVMKVPLHIKGKPLPMSYALQGLKGVITTSDYRNKKVVAAYSPAGNLGIGLVWKVDADQLYQSIYSNLYRIALTLFALIAIGILLLRWQVVPLVSRLVRAEARIRAVVENVLDGLITIDEQGVIESANPASEKIFGYSAKEMVGKNITMLMPATMREQHSHGMKNYLTSGKSVLIGKGNVEVMGQRKNGVLFPLELSISEMQADGKRLFIGILRDVTHTKQLSKESHLAAKVIGATQEGVVIMDADRTIESINYAFTRITGYDLEDVRGKKLEALHIALRNPEIFEQILRDIRLNGQWQGPVSGINKSGNPYHIWASIDAIEDETGAVSHVVAMFSDVTEKKLSEERIYHLAHYDALTDLPNRLSLNDRLQHAMAYAQRHERLVAVMFLDLDHFKNINDTLGHAVGDSLLQAVAKRLLGCVRECDTVGRLGGDEFTIILTDIKHANDAMIVAQKILEHLCQPFVLQDRELFITASIGVTLYPLDNDSPLELIKNADTAMYRAKDQGRNNYQFYTSDMNVLALANLELQSGLHKALQRAEFELHYQPQVNMKTGEIVGMEALARWRHPEKGLISPALFIPVAEESGLIVSLGEWVLRTACEQNMVWQRAGVKPIRMAVNLSARQFQQKNLLQMITQVLSETGMRPEYLELELTEGLVMQNAQATIRILHQLKEMGVRVSIDDFGTGYSSLSYLKRFPIDTLKIDQAFVRDITTDPDDAAIATAIIAMAHSLKFKVVAEGVETQEQLTFLCNKACDEMQGYFFSRPLPAEEIGLLLQSERRLKIAC